MDLPRRLLQPFLGARILKTGISVFVSLAVFHWFGSEYATFAAVAAILAVQPSVNKAREVLRQQLLGNLVAGAVAAILGLWLPVNPVTMALGCILALGLLNRFKLSEAAGLAVVVILFIMDRPEHDFLMYTAARLGAIAGGMGLGYLVNRFIAPPDLFGRVREEIWHGSEQVDQFIGRLIASLSAPEHYEKEQIKQEATAIQRHLDAARAFLELGASEIEPAMQLRLKKANASMFVFTEGVMDIHKLVLEMSGLAYGPERDVVANALHAVRRYKQEVMRAAFEGSRLDPAATEACEAAKAALQERVEALVDRRESRERGLLLHGVLGRIRHMARRMASLNRLVN